jgi:hypothetical protein
MAKSKENIEAAEEQQPAEETKKTEKKESPLKGIIKSISELSQKDRLVLYKRIDGLANHDKDRYSSGVDADPGIFEQAINSL